MKKPIILITALLAGAMAQAEVLSPAQALQRISTQSAGAGVRKAAARAATDAIPARVVRNYDADPEVYLFAPADGDMLIVSAESETPALLGYIENAEPFGNVPPALEYLMNCYAEEIHAMRIGNIIYGDTPAEEDFEPIPVVTPTLWDQGGPYYDMCPERTDGFNPHYATGCVATAMAQVLYTHKYPAKCSGGEYTYIWREAGQELTINFDDVTLDWDNMLPEYPNNGANATQEQKDAVATLMKAVGYSANMNYTPGGSGTHGFVMAAALVKFFDYDITTAFYQRRWIPMSTWKKMIYDELATGHAVYMDAQTGVEQVSAHAFMIDGYQGDGFFHVNWGWGGLSNGYFLLTTMEPGAQGIGGAAVPSGYCASQGIILGMNHGRKGNIEDAKPIFYITDSFFAKTPSVELGQSVGFDGSVYYHMSALTNAVNVAPAVKFTHENGTEYYVHEEANLTIPSSISGGIYSMRLPEITVPTDLPEGKYIVSPAVYSNRKDEYYDTYTSVGMGGKSVATVSGSTITFENPAMAALTCNSADVPAKVTVDKDYNITLSLTNTSSEDYDGYINAWIVKPGQDTKRASFNRLHANIEAGKTINATGRFKISDLTVPTGNYEVIFLDQREQVISDRSSIRVFGKANAAELTGESLVCTSNAIKDLSFDVKVTATEGNFLGKVYVEIRLKKNDPPLVTLQSNETVSILEGETATVTVSGSFPDGTIGKSYGAYVCYDRVNERIEVSGSLANRYVIFKLMEESKLNEINCAKQNIPDEYYDLCGRRVTNPVKGIFIHRRGSDSEKIIL